MDEVFYDKDDETAENAAEIYNVADYVAVDVEHLGLSISSSAKDTD